MSDKVAQLQADVDHVDKLERAQSRLMFALKDMGYTWKVGKAESVSEYGIAYNSWNNGPTSEGLALVENFFDPDDAVDAALRGFYHSRLFDGNEHIVWRVPPELTSDRSDDFVKKFGCKVRYKLYFRYHFLKEK